MYKRLISRPKKSFLLLGPRGTGKSTWLRTTSFDLAIDLLKSRTRLDFQADPGILHDQVSNLKPGSWVLIDEVQKIPELLDEVHSIYEEKKIHFALSGSSARKLKRSGVNLLAGRALSYSMFPLIYPEYGAHQNIQTLVEWGTLPLVMDQPEFRAETLDTYVDTYLRQELLEEGLIRNLAPFSRFLKVAGLRNGQILNTERIASDCKVGRTTVDKYFEVLIDTLIGYRLPAYLPGLKEKEVSHSKFYFFDSGVARAASGQTGHSVSPESWGFYFETYLLNEIRAYLSYKKIKNNLFHYAVSGSGDIDLIIQHRPREISRAEQVTLVEFKASHDWDSKWTKSLLDFSARNKKIKIQRLIGVYLGDRRLTQKDVEILPVFEFLSELNSGKIAYTA